MNEQPEPQDLIASAEAYMQRFPYHCLVAEMMDEVKRLRQRVLAAETNAKLVSWASRQTLDGARLRADAADAEVKRLQEGAAESASFIFHMGRHAAEIALQKSRLEAEVQRLRKVLEWIGQTVHQAHHDGPMEPCSKSICQSVRDAARLGN